PWGRAHFPPAWRAVASRIRVPSEGGSGGIVQWAAWGVTNALVRDRAGERGVSLAGGFDLRKLPAGFYDNPFPYYAALRAESPIRRMADGSVFVSRYADVEFVYKHPKIFSSDKKREFGEKYGVTPLFEHHTTSLVFNDPPLHTRVRKLVAGSLTPR